jgi:hypothetical protein
MEQIEYKQFLVYDQLCELGIPYGFTELAYQISADYKTLFIQKIDRVERTTKHLDIPITKAYVSDRQVLKDFLVDLMSYVGNFYGMPQYESSEIFSKEEFELMLNKAINIMDERKQVAIEKNRENEIIRYCFSKNLNPEPEGRHPNYWKAQCPSGGQHNIYISTESNEWGCGYCKKKGKLEDLKKWLESIYR